MGIHYVIIILTKIDTLHDQHQIYLKEYIMVIHKDKIDVENMHKTIDKS